MSFFCWIFNKFYIESQEQNCGFRYEFDNIIRQRIVNGKILGPPNISNDANENNDGDIDSNMSTNMTNEATNLVNESTQRKSILDQFDTINNRGGGDCFYLSIAQAQPLSGNDNLEEIANSLRTLASETIKNDILNIDVDTITADYGFIDNTNSTISQPPKNLEEVAELIKTPGKWAGQYEILAIEQALQYKIILINEDGHIHESICQSYPFHVNPKGGYVFLKYSNRAQHYELLRLKGVEVETGGIKFADIPDNIKDEICRLCVNGKSETGFSDIPEFKEYCNSINETSQVIGGSKKYNSHSITRHIKIKKNNITREKNRIIKKSSKKYYRKKNNTKKSKQ